MTAKEAQELEALSSIWPKIGCIVKAVAKFVACEATGGQNCGNQLVADIKACFK
jgi:hypothetical protein